MPIRVATQALGAGVKAARPVPRWLSSRPFAVPGEPRETAQGEPTRVAAGPSFSFGRLVLQPKLAIGRSDDPFEQEADRVAERVMRMPAPHIAIAAAPRQLSRKCDACEEEEAKLRTKRTGPPQAAATAAPAIVHEAISSGGQQLDPPTRSFFESRFGYDFGNIRVHTDRKASASAQAVDALAYTVGHNVVFGAGQYAPRSSTGRNLIAHELTHVLQQSAAASPNPAITPPVAADNPAERPACQASPQGVDAAAARPETEADGQRVLSAPAIRIQRQVAPSTQAAAVSRGAPVVEDGQPTAAGQMVRSDFLTALRAALVRECDIEFAPVGRSAMDCPYIFHTIDYYATRPVASLMRVIRHFAHPQAGADANDLIQAVTLRARAIARRVASRSTPRAQAMAARDGGIAPHEASAVRSQLGSGQKLETSVRLRMEDAFGQTFAAVRVHDDTAAARLNQALGAQAFTVGNDIAFSAGSYRPRTSTGDALVAHELAHTIQQGAGASGVPAAADEATLEQQADHAAAAAISGRHDALEALRPGQAGTRVQRLPAVVAGGLMLAEATPEIVVAAELGTELVVTDGVVTVAAPTVVEAVAPVVVESVAPTVVESVAPTVANTVVASSAASMLPTAATLAGVGALTTLSGDSPTPESPQSRCQQQYGYAPCIDLRGIEQVAASFASNQVEVTGVRCEGVSSFSAGEMFDCGGAPGENWHCTINDSEFVISLNGCVCCNPDGTPGFEWHPHQSPGSENERGRRRQDTRQDRRERQQRDRQRARRRDEGDDND